MQRNFRLLALAIVILLIITGVVLYIMLGGGKNVGKNGNDNFSWSFFNTFPDTGNDSENTRKAASENAANTAGYDEIKLIQLVDTPVIGPAVDESAGKVMFFKKGEGKLFSISYDGEGGENKISNLTIKDIIGVKWSASLKSAFITTYFKAHKKNFWFNIVGTSTIESGEFPDGITSAAFSPTKEKLAMVVRFGEQSWVSITDPDGSKAATIYKTPVPDFDIYWPSDDFIALKTKSSGYAPSLLETIPVSGGHESPVRSDVYGFDILWSPDGSSYIASKTTDQAKKISIELASLNNPEDAEEFQFKTLPEKCAFSKKERAVIYCAIPQQDLGRMQLPDSWWQGKTQFNDSLWKINSETGEFNEIIQQSPFDITNIFLSPNEEYIFFINKKDSTLWSLKTI